MIDARIWLAVMLLGYGCAPSIAGQRNAARSSVELLKAGRFEDARSTATRVIAADARNPQAHLVAAIADYQQAMRALVDLRAMPDQLLGGAFDAQQLPAMLARSTEALTSVDRHLTAATAAPWVDLELCVACWKVDWNHNGRLDEGDEHLLEIERDADGKRLPDGDPRRKPTFRFDLGDVYWARAMVSFQRGLIALAKSVHWEDLNTLVASLRTDTKRIVIHLDDKERIHVARALFLAALDDADRARREYLAERDDDREWVPNTHQKSHPLPLPVDDALYQTWADLVGDLRRLIAGEEGLDVSEIARLARNTETPLHGFMGRVGHDSGRAWRSCRRRRAGKGELLEAAAAERPIVRSAALLALAMLSAYQILDRLPQRDELITQRGLPGKDAGVHHAAASVVRDAIRFDLKDEVDTFYFDNGGVVFEVGGAQVRAGFPVCGLYRLSDGAGADV